METQTQDTHPQDPIDRLTLCIEELRSMPGVRGQMWLLHLLFLDFFMSMFKMLASLAEMRRNGTLPAVAPAAAPEEPRAWPADLRPRESGWLEHRDLHDPWGEPEVTAPIAEAQCEMAPREEPGVEQPAGLPPKARVRT